MKLTPLKINLLLHIYAIAEPFNHPEAPAYEEAEREFVANDLIRKNTSCPCGYESTPRGRAFIRMLLQTPLPIEQWIDPRTKIVVK